MTTVLAIESENEVSIAWDRQITLGQRKISGATKAFVNNGIIFLGCGRLLDVQIIQYANLPDPKMAGWDIDRWMTRELIPAIQSALNSREATEKTNSKVYSGGSLLVIVNSRVYQISDDLSWLRSDDGIYGVGSGSPYALGALHAKTSLDEAMVIASQLDSFTGMEFTVTTATEMLSA